MKNNSKAMAYVVIGIVGFFLGWLGMMVMYISSDFLPVYVGKTYVIGNQILRYILYILLIFEMALSARLADYGIKFLIKRFRKIWKTLK